MSRHYFLKKLGCVVSIPAVIAAIATTYQKPANALSNANPSIHTSFQTVDPVVSVDTAPTELISQYATYGFWLTNSRSITLTYLYASSADSSSWGRDILGRDTIAPYEEGMVTIDDGYESCLYDLKAVFSDGSETTRRNVNVCTLSHFTFN